MSNSNIQVTIKGVKELQDALRRMPVVAVNEISKATEKSMILIWNNSIKEAPVNKQSGGGNLRQLIRGKMINRLSGVVQAFANYSIYVLEGTRPHTIEVRQAKVLANKRTGQFFGRKVQHPGTAPNPFFERAIKDSVSKIDGYVGLALQNIVNVLK